MSCRIAVLGCRGEEPRCIHNESGRKAEYFARRRAFVTTNILLGSAIFGVQCAAVS